MKLPAYAMGQASFPELYEHLLVGPLFRPWAELVLDRVRLAPGDRVLDIACGTGIVARLAKERLGAGGTVVGVDVSAPMLEVARTIEPGVDWREGNASALPIRAGETFDVVVCQQGIQFFPEQEAAAREMRRALASGGRLAVSAWRPNAEIPFFHDLQQVAERHLGPIVDPRHGAGDAGAIERLLAVAGFRDVRVETLSLTTRFVDGAVFISMNTMALVGMRAQGASLADEERARVVETIVDESAAVMPSYGDGKAIAFEMATNFATARG